MVVISPSVLFSGVVSGADQPSSEALALNDIFDGDQLIESALVTHQATKKTGTEDRFEFLWQYVLPGPTHSDLRVRVSFTPTHPVLLSVDAGQETGSIGGQLVSPALDLVDVADQAGNLQLLESRLVELKVATQFGIVPVAGRTATPHLREKNRLALLPCHHSSSQNGYRRPSSRR